MPTMPCCGLCRHRLFALSTDPVGLLLTCAKVVATGSAAKARHLMCFRALLSGSLPTTPPPPAQPTGGNRPQGPPRDAHRPGPTHNCFFVPLLHAAAGRVAPQAVHGWEADTRYGVSFRAVFAAFHRAQSVPPPAIVMLCIYCSYLPPTGGQCISPKPSCPTRSRPMPWCISRQLHTCVNSTLEWPGFGQPQPAGAPPPHPLDQLARKVIQSVHLQFLRAIKPLSPCAGHGSSPIFRPAMPRGSTNWPRVGPGQSTPPQPSVPSRGRAAIAISHRCPSNRKLPVRPFRPSGGGSCGCSCLACCFTVPAA